MGDYSPKNPRIRRPSFTSQDVREKAIELRDTLLANLDFIEECITEDLDQLKRYKDRFGDTRYRPLIRPSEGSIEAQYGSPTETVMEPLASQYRATINSLLQSIRLIQTEILPEDDPEGATSRNDSKGQASKRASLRDTFQSDAATEKKPIPPTEPTDELIPRAKLVEIEKQAIKALNKPNIESNTDDEPESIPRIMPDHAKSVAPTQMPWRQTTPSAQTKFVPSSPKRPTLEQLKANHPTNADASTDDSIAPPTKPHVENKPKSKTANTTPVGLSPQLRMQMQSGSSRLDSIRDKYASGESRVVSTKKNNESNDE